MGPLLPTAAVGAVAGLAAHRAKEEPALAPAELPDWLQQLRPEQAEAPTQPTLIQAEIPAWLEALRPAEVEEGAGETAAEVEAVGKGRTSGRTGERVAGRAGHGASSRLACELRYEVSADDQARAGVLKELMARPVSAPRKAEAYLAKSGPMRRRALRWVITALLLTVLLLPPTFHGCYFTC